MHTCVCSVVSDSATPWTVARQIPQSMVFSRQENRSGMPVPTPGDLPDPGIIPMFLAPLALADRFVTIVQPGKRSLSFTAGKLSTWS